MHERRCLDEQECAMEVMFCCFPRLFDGIELSSCGEALPMEGGECDGEKCTVLLSYVAEPYQLRTAPVYVAEPYQLRTVACLSGGAVPAPHSHLSILALYSL